VKAFAYYLSEASAERVSAQLEFFPDFPTLELPFDHILLALTKRMWVVFTKPSICLKTPRRCVYCRTDSVATNATSSVDTLIVKENLSIS